MKRLILLSLLGGFGLCFTPSEAQQKKQKLGDYFGDMRARHIGPAVMSGRINDLELHPTNPRIIYAGSAGGGVWKSNDGGATFNPIFRRALSVHWCCGLGPQRSRQHPLCWHRRNLDKKQRPCWRRPIQINGWRYQLEKIGFEQSERIANILINPNNSNEIYVGVLGALWSDNDERVYKSIDGGNTWERILYDGPATGCADLAMDPKDPNILYASMWEFRRTAWSFNSGGAKSALYKSTDGGASWNKIHKGFPEGKLGRLAIAVAPSDPSILYTVIEAEEQDRKDCIAAMMADGTGNKVTMTFGITVRPFYFSRLVVDPTDPNVIVKAGLSGSISRDGGKTFKDLGTMHSDIHDVAFHIKDADYLFAGTDGGVYRFWNGNNL